MQSTVSCVGRTLGIPIPVTKAIFPKFLSSCMRRLFWGIDRASLPWLTFHVSPCPSFRLHWRRPIWCILPSRLLSPPFLFSRSLHFAPLSSLSLSLSLSLESAPQAPPPSFLSFLLPFRRGAFAGIALFSALPLCLASRLSYQLFGFAPGLAEPRPRIHILNFVQGKVGASNARARG